MAMQLQPGSGSTKDIVEKAANQCIQLVKAEPDIVCLPEAWIWKNSVVPRHELRNVYSLAVKAFTRLAIELGTYVVLGGVPKSTAHGDFVSSPVIDPTGNVVGEQLKTHLFRGEKTRFKPGTSLEIFKMGNLNVGILVCHDIAFPEAARVLTLKGAALILNPSRISAAGIEPWQLYIKTRALENRVPIVGANILAPSQYPGRSLIVDLAILEEEQIVYPVVKAEAEHEEKFISCNIDPNMINKLRKERLGNRVPAIYKEIAL